ncbi:MAG: hypothetical protein ACT4NP_07925 [Pseudonocardiales bacterium]
MNSTLPTSPLRANVGAVEFTTRTIAAQGVPVFLSLLDVEQLRIRSSALE